MGTCPHRDEATHQTINEVRGENGQIKAATQLRVQVLTIRYEKVNGVNENCRMGCQDYDVTDHMAKTTTIVNLIMRRKRSESAR